VTTPPLLVIEPVIVLFAAVRLVKLRVLLLDVFEFRMSVPAIVVDKVASAGNAIVVAIAALLLIWSVEALFIVKTLVVAALPKVRVEVAVEDKLTSVLLVTISCRIVCVGTAVTVSVVPLLN